MKALHIIKIGGKLLDNPVQLKELLSTFAQLNVPKILVHGGGKKASSLCQKLGITPQMKAGRRITDEATLEVVTMVYAGLINKQVVSQLQAFQCNAVGCTGADGNLILAKKRAAVPIDYGFAGDIESVNTEQLVQFLEGGITPVFCAITHDGNGQLLNTNADTIATSLAIALSKHYEVNLKFCFEKEGVLADPTNDLSVLTNLSQEEYFLERKKGSISDGMIPKLDNAFSAKKAKVHNVKICGSTGITTSKGTEICL